jgi:hypothetical protein
MMAMDENLKRAQQIVQGRAFNRPGDIDGERLVGFVVSEEVAGLSDAIFALDAIRAALSAAQPVPGVKELEWAETCWQDGHPIRWTGQIAGARLFYLIKHDVDGKFECCDRDHESLDEAKATAQADFEARIRSALIPTPQPVESQGEPVAKRYCQCKSLTNPCIVCGLPKFIDPTWLKRKIEEEPDDVEIGAGFELFPLPSATPPSPAQGTVERAEPVAWERFNETMDRWLETPAEDIPRYRELGIAVRPLFTSPPVDSDAVRALDGQERMLLGWMLAAFEQSKIGHPITDDLKREMRDANRLVARLSAGSQGSGSDD